MRMNEQLKAIIFQRKLHRSSTHSNQIVHSDNGHEIK